MDRGYCHASGIHYASSKKAYLIVGINPDGILLHAPDGSGFGLLESLKSIGTAGQMGQWEVLLPFENNAPVSARLCVVRKSQTAIALAHKKLRRHASKHGTQLQPETLLYAPYVMVLTTFPREEFSLQQVLEQYRFRWQIELVFKRFKQIAQLGHLPKYDEDSALPGFMENCSSPCSPRNSSGMPTPFPLGIPVGASSALPADGVSFLSRFTKLPRLSNRSLLSATYWHTGDRSQNAWLKRLASANRRSKHSRKQVSAYAAEPGFSLW